MIRGHTGVIYEPPDPRVRRYSADVLIGIGEPNVSMGGMVHLLGGRWPDQELTDACVAHAISQAIWIRQCVLRMGVHERFFPSQLDLYFRGRAKRVGWKNVIDIGSNPVAVWEITRSPTGIVPYGNLQWDPMLVDKRPDPALTRWAVDWRDKINYHWVLSSGTSRCVDVDGLLQSGRPVTAALTVDQGLLDWTPGHGPWSFQGPRKGGHYVLLTGVDSRGDYDAIGSWGGDYGDHGMHKIARSEIASDRTSYLATPEIRQ